MQSTTALLLLFTVTPSFCQRSFYAGRRPIGYPEITKPVNVETRFAEELPPQLNGDAEYAHRLDQLPLDSQPFWYLNWKQYQEERKHPQTYPQRPNPFLDNNNV